MSGFATINTKLKAIIEGLTGTAKPLSAVYNYRNAMPAAYPCALVFAFGGSEENRIDSGSNFLTMKFLVRVMIREKNTQAQENLRISILDSVLDELRKNADTLGGVCEKFDIESIELKDFSATDIPVIGFDITITASKLRTI